MEFKSTGNTTDRSSRVKLLIVIESTRWISRVLPRQRQVVKNRRERQREKYAIVSFATQPCQPGWRSKIDSETYRSLSGNNRRNDEELPWIQCDIYIYRLPSLQSFIRSRKARATVFRFSASCVLANWRIRKAIAAAITTRKSLPNKSRDNDSDRCL